MNEIFEESKCPKSGCCPKGKPRSTLLYTASWKRYNMNLRNYCVVNPGFVRNSRNLASTVDTKDCNDPIMTE